MLTVFDSSACMYKNRNIFLLIHQQGSKESRKIIGISLSLALTTLGSVYRIRILDLNKSIMKSKEMCFQKHVLS